MFQTDFGSVLNAFGGLLLMGLAGFVLWVAPKRAVNRAFAGFSAGLGVWAITWNLPERVDPVFSWFFLVGAVGFAVASTGLLAVALLYPSRVSAKEWVRVMIAAMVALPTGVVWIILAIANNETRQMAFGFPESSYGVALAGEITGGVFMSTVLFTLVLFALRYQKSSETAGIQYALMSGALVIWPATVNASFTFFDDGVSHIRSPLFILVLVMAAGLWLWNTRIAPANRARNVAWTLLIAPLAGLLFAVGLGGFSATVQSGFFGIARTITVAVFGYAIVRHQLLGIDVKVKWTLKQSTVAAVFIAVFFTVSEGTAALFEAQTGSVAIGILAAGALVFAIAPLQRFAERVADRAMPGVKPIGEMTQEDRAELYRAQVALAYKDNAVTQAERRMLLGLRKQLDLSYEIAARIEEEAVRA